MCGICGYISKRPVSVDQLKQMNDTMYHRGPNDSGEEIYSLHQGYTVGMAHRRLSILDLSSRGHQPMHSCDGRITVVYNGEIYNYRELKKQLSDYSFQSECDTEVIIAAYLKWGGNFVERLNGMFAIALFDRDREELYLYRDRIGKKPLYYYFENQTFVFASELKPIMAFPDFTKKIAGDVLGQYLFHQYICGEQSIFQNVYRLQPGTYLVYKYGELKIKKYWDICERYRANLLHLNTDYSRAKEELNELLLDSVKKRMIADVPVGTFLSGGYDSSLVTALVQKVSTQPIKTFCIGFHEKEFNEAEYAKQIAAYLGTEHTEYYIEEADMLSLVDSIPKYFDEPFADSSQIPSMLVSKLARQQVTVVLSGDGGDEFFCGYTKYEKQQLAQKLDVIGTAIRAVSHMPGLTELELTKKLPYRWRTIINNADKRYKTQYGILNYISTIQKLLGKDSVQVQFDESQISEKDWQKRAMLLDQKTYLPDDILCKVDRATMKYSLEARCPILDYRVMEYAYSLPHKYKCYRGDKKHILKDIAYDYIPREMLERPKKGFSVPMDEWLRGPLKERLIDFSNESYLKKQGLFNATAINQYVNEYLINGDGVLGQGLAHSRILWAFLVFQMWVEKIMIENENDFR